jgi:hypothetical protein
MFELWLLDMYRVSHPDQLMRGRTKYVFYRCKEAPIKKFLTYFGVNEVIKWK